MPEHADPTACGSTINTAIRTRTCALPAGHGGEPEPEPIPEPLVSVANLTIRVDGHGDGLPYLDVDLYPGGTCLTADQAEQVGVALLGWARTQQGAAYAQKHGEVKA